MKTQTDKVCNRTACSNSTEKHYLIWNDRVPGQPSKYCVTCGKKIMRFSPKLRYEIINESNGRVEKSYITRAN